MLKVSDVRKSVGPPAFTIDPFVTQLSYVALRALIVLDGRLYYRSAKSTKEFADLVIFLRILRI